MNLLDFSKDLSDLIEKSGQSVVSVNARHRFPATGVAWDGSGIIVTAHHVIEREDAIQISQAGSGPHPARLVGRDPTTDLAVLKLEDGSLRLRALPEAAPARVGSLVAALGRPGSRIQASLGMVEADGPAWRTAAGGSVDAYIQSSIEMLPGFSGGPLVGMDGGLIGINTSALQSSGSLTLPRVTIARVVNSLVANGRIRRAYLGITSQPVRLGEESAATAGQPSGLIIVGVESGGPAASAGMLQGDILISAGGSATRRIEDLVAALTSDNPEAEMTLQVLRGGKIVELKIKPIEK